MDNCDHTISATGVFTPTQSDREAMAVPTATPLVEPSLWVLQRFENGCMPSPTAGLPELKHDQINLQGLLCRTRAYLGGIV